MKFEEIYEIYWDKIFRLCMGYLNNSEKAKDLAQDTFVIVWKRLNTFRNESNIGTWIFRIACNNCLRQLEKDSRMPYSEFPEHLEHKSGTDFKEEIKLLYHFISELKELDRMIISLELEGIDQSQIAQIVGISDINVRVKIHRIKEKLTQKFNHHGK